MKYLRLRNYYEDDIEYDTIVIFERDYADSKVEKAMRELWNIQKETQKSFNAETWLNEKGLKIKDAIILNDIDVICTR